VKAKPYGFRTWTEDHISQFEAFYPTDSRARLAFALLLYTGQRRGDVVRMGRQHIRDGFIEVRQAKTGATVEIPIHPELQAILDASRAEHLTFPTTATGKPFTGGSFTNWFGDLCRKAGLPLGLSAHGLRKAMCRRLAEAAAISGHASLKEVQRYTKAANQRRMAIDAMETIQRTETVKPDRKIWQTPAQVIEKKGDEYVSLVWTSTSSTSPSGPRRARGRPSDHRS
jgi:integrase